MPSTILLLSQADALCVAFICSKVELEEQELKEISSNFELWKFFLVAYLNLYKSGKCL